MKAAVVTDDLRTVSPHFGMARHFLVYEILEGEVKGKEARDKAAHARGAHLHIGGEESGFHDSVLSAIADCEVVISGGMGRPMFESIRTAGIKAYVTRIRTADEAVKALAKGTLDNSLELFHEA
ncbi:MAG: iron-molybdenum cofactor biosynthesis protein [Nitrososphaerota archaeon]|jgi:predicted Fe-Mo cluster-binding NifX family protein|nr:iron-molybdenum cofactor biosynthesis protein [Nitrososphaerota archaeon]MDG6943110.1 iron-molybdenum cofactor biosynthesis protein [Nitrososphaerota archaeon]MDG6951012.1 iron-molybdenum cofactor biosynthesis protein [Nitrososphaerota archaeon]